jgi:hypothetical protein
VTIQDAGGSSATAVTTASVADAPLSATGTSLTATEDSSFSGVVASFTDADPNATAGNYRVLVDWGDNSTSGGTVAAGPSGGFVVNASHTYAEEGTYAVTVSVVDLSGGSSAATSTTAAVADAPIYVSASAPVYAQEGTAVSGAVAFLDDADFNAPLSDYTVTINWGDGTTSAGTVTNGAVIGYEVDGSHVYAEEGTYSISVTVADVGGSTSTAVNTAFATDAPLMAMGQDGTATAGVAFSGVVATFSDANPNADVGDFSATIGWGDGTTTPATVRPSQGGGFEVVLDHTFASPGTVPLSITINDGGGAFALASSTITVNPA